LLVRIPDWSVNTCPCHRQLVLWSLYIKTSR
jgi:hypothetical protein